MKPSQRFHLNRLAEKLVTPERFGDDFDWPFRPLRDVLPDLVQQWHDYVATTVYLTPDEVRFDNPDVDGTYPNRAFPFPATRKDHRA